MNAIHHFDPIFAKVIEPELVEELFCDWINSSNLKLVL